MLEKELHNLYHYKNNKVIKIIRYDIDEETETMLQKLESHKIHQVDKLKQHPSLLYPKAVLIDENGYRGYLMDEITSTPFSYESEIKEICNYFKAVENVMEFGHQEGIVFLDIFSRGNISYQKDNHQVTFLDFDGWQIKNIPTCTSTQLPRCNDEIRLNPRFKNKDLYTINFRKDNIQDQLNQIYQILNLEDNIAIQSVINTAFDFQAEDNIPKIEPIIYAIERQVNKSKKTLQKKM